MGSARVRTRVLPQIGNVPNQIPRRVPATGPVVFVAPLIILVFAQKALVERVTLKGVDG